MILHAPLLLRVIASVRTIARLAVAAHVAVVRSFSFFLALSLSFALFFAFSLALSVAASAEAADVLEGTVFLDANGNGVRDAGESFRSGVPISNGREIVRSDSQGRYRLNAQGAGFAVISCPADARCPKRYLRASGDFPLIPTRRATDFFFVQMSDVHAYPDGGELGTLLDPDAVPWWVPRFVIGWFVQAGLERMYPDRTSDEIVASLKAAAAPYRDLDDAWDFQVMVAYLEVVLDPSLGLLRPGELIPAAFAEVSRLKPELVINTGDLILEGNSGDPEPVERWYEYYQQVSRASGLPFYNTIGNNELGGTDNDDFKSDDPRHGKALFRKYFGPTHYSFDYGSYHFVALDTHHPPQAKGGEPANPEGKWSFEQMQPEVREWLDADLALAAAAGKTLVVLNHEPFHIDPRWDLDDDAEHADDQGLFAKHGVRYSLAGHIHRNGFQDASAEDAVTHITTAALSGFRWALPADLDNRGFRLFYSHEGALYSAWKRTGEGVLAFIDPRRVDADHPASRGASDPGALEGTVEVVAVAVDVDRPYASLTLELDGKPLALARWGDFFVHASFDATRLGQGEKELVLRGIRQDGGSDRTVLEVASGR